MNPTNERPAQGERSAPDGGEPAPGPLREGEPGGVTLVRDSQPKARIVLAGKPTRSARLGALELQAHLRAITGATLPIGTAGGEAGGVTIFVGANPEAGLGNEAFQEQEYRVRVGGQSILLVGRDAQEFGPVTFDPDDPAAWDGLPGFWEERGSLHAVYDFLENGCGVRWLTHTERGTVRPRRATLTVAPCDIRRAPAFRFRDTMGAYKDRAGRYDNCACLWPGEGWYREPAPEFLRWRELAYAGLSGRYPDPAAFRRARENLAFIFLLRRKNGGAPNACNHSLCGYYDRFWERSEDPGKAALFEERRPQLFAQGYQGRPEQLCYTQPELVRQVAQDARDYLDGRKTGAELGIFWDPKPPNPFPIESMDNSFYCRCPECRKHIDPAAGGTDKTFSAGTYSDYFFGFVNAVAREVQKTHPGGRIITLAYGSHAVPPSFPIESNVDVQYCFWTNRILGPAHAADLALLDRWTEEKRRSGRPLGLWLYYTFPTETAYRGRYHCFPGFFAHTIGEQMRRFREAGIYGMFHCGFGQEVEAYVTFRLMDDPGQDVDRLLEEYFHGLYGAAAEPMRRLYLDMEQAYCDPARRPAAKVSGPSLSWEYICRGEDMQRFGALMDRARALAVSEPDRTNVALFDRAVWSYVTAGRERFLARSSAPMPSGLVPRGPAGGGDPDRAAWDRAAGLSGGWFECGSDRPARRALSARAVHDGDFLYLELTDPCPVDRLVSNAGVFPYDDWELFVAGQRDLPYRHYSFNPAGTLAQYSNGEVNARVGVPVEGLRIRVANDLSDPARWRARIALPLPGSLPHSRLGEGNRIYLNIARLSGPGVHNGEAGIDTWVSHTTVHEADRLGELTLGD